ncbi:MAG: serine protease [Actinobacteria bacterium]|nr:serine protease [Actinomycetota bacterium]
MRVLAADGRSTGTGFLVGERLIVPCAHLLVDLASTAPPAAETVTVRFTQVDDTERTAEVDPQLWRAPAGADVAFLRLVDPPPVQASPLRLGASAGVAQHRVKVFGFPSGGFRGGHYGYGVAGDRIHDDSGAPLLQLTGCTEVTEGFSGGPVLDEHTGLVVGMVNSVTAPDRLGRGQASAFVTVAETLREVCSQLTLTELCPYRGLEAFTTDDVDWFHGRDRVVAAVLAGLGATPDFLRCWVPPGAASLLSSRPGCSLPWRVAGFQAASGGDGSMPGWARTRMPSWNRLA